VNIESQTAGRLRGLSGQRHAVTYAPNPDHVCPIYCSNVLVYFATTRRVINGATMHCATRQFTLLIVCDLLLAACRLSYARMLASCWDGIVRTIRFHVLLDCTPPILTPLTLAILDVGLRN
jgi:hypothetical protein